MSYETKALLIAIGNLVQNIEDREKLYEAISEMANSEGVVLKPFEKKSEKKFDEKNNQN